VRQKDLVGEGHPLLAIAPGQRLFLDAAGGAVDPARCIAVVALEIPDRQIREQTLGLSIVQAAPFAAFGTNWPLLRRGSMSMTRASTPSTSMTQMEP
jgi:hypothetical protein